MTATRRDFLKHAASGAVLLGLGAAGWSKNASPTKQPNILLITADDLNCDSVGVYGCKTPDITPNIDKLAAAGVRFEHAHVTIAVCQPCRGVLATGRYPHRSGIEGFQRLPAAKKDIQLVTERLRAGGYLNGILGKVGHSSPKASFKWDMSYDMPQLGKGRDPKLYAKYAKEFFLRAKSQGKPFYLMANSHDPHRPFAGSDQEAGMRRGGKLTPPSRTYKPSEINIPGFLPDIPNVRREIAEYYSSVKRCDDTVGALLKALDESGQADNTLVMFISDHGMALPFAKTNCYLHSTRTPWIVRWPGVVKGPKINKTHFISCIDFMPTALEAAGLDKDDTVDGTSFLSILKGGKQTGRDKVFTQFHQTAGRRRFPMRTVQDKRFGYIFNPWSDGKTAFKNESQSGRSFKAMQAAAKDDAKIAARVKLFQYRVVEEFYDFAKDPDALNNLIDNAEYKPQLDKMRAELLKWMIATKDPVREAFEKRDSPEALAKFMAEQNAKSRAMPRKNKKKKQTNNNRRKKRNAEVGK
ncbi:MAG: sulfatase [Phycisphaerae bacterium]|jgi:N-sulfoglucosamine sulfohydrolase|nr:sulfatase [Phycisphaerae bacterium]